MDASVEHLDKTRPGFWTADDEDRWADIAFTARVGAHFACEPGWELLPRTRPNHQIWLITGHAAEFTVGDSAPARLSARSALVLPPGITHAATHNPRRPVRCYVLHFVARAHGLPLGGVLPACALRCLRPRDWTALTAAGADMCAQLAGRQPGRRLLANAAATRLLGLLRGAAGAADTQALASEPPLPQPVAMMLGHLRRHHDEPLTMASIASAAHLSPERAGHLFRAAVGTSPLRYLRDYRIERARQMLRETDLPVAAVAARVGYADPFYFTRVFSRAEGMPPSDYRESARGQSLI